MGVDSALRAKMQELHSRLYPEGARLTPAAFDDLVVELRVLERKVKAPDDRKALNNLVHTFLKVGMHVKGA